MIVEPCRFCGGKGKRRFVPRDSVFPLEIKCNRCRGTGSYELRHDSQRKFAFYERVDGSVARRRVSKTWHKNVWRADRDGP